MHDGFLSFVFIYLKIYKMLLIRKLFFHSLIRRYMIVLETIYTYCYCGD